MSEKPVLDKEAEYDRRPEELDDIRDVTRTRPDESYFRCGYLIAGGKPQMLDQYARNRQSAEKKARAEATRVRGELVKLGASVAVSWWVQPWRVETSEKYDLAEVVEL